MPFRLLFRDERANIPWYHSNSQTLLRLRTPFSVTGNPARIYL